jgi:hypothetical protein
MSHSMSTANPAMVAASPWRTAAPAATAIASAVAPRTSPPR